MISSLCSRVAVALLILSIYSEMFASKGYEAQDFSDVSHLKLNGQAQVIEGVGDDPTLLRLTPAQGNKAGSVFSSRKQQARSFSTYFQFRISEPGGSVFDCNEKPGADGIVFVVQSVSSDLGSSGAGIGFAGIPNSVGVEFDTWCNHGNRDPDSNHLAIDINGSVVHAVGEEMVSFEHEFDNGNIWHVWVDYDGYWLEVRVSEQAERPDPPTLVKELAIREILGSDDAYIGFTSGTGADWGNHDILVWEYRDHYEPVGSSQRSIRVRNAELKRTEPHPEELGSVLFILDASASMRETTANGDSRIRVALSALESMVKASLNETIQFGLRVFGHRGGPNCASELLIPVAPLKVSSAMSVISNIRSSSLGNTSLAEALNLAAIDFKTAPRKHRIIVLTDGEETCGGDPAHSIQLLMDAGLQVEVSIVGFAVESSELKSTYRAWAEMTGGQYYDTADLEGLKQSLGAATRAKEEQFQHFVVIDSSGIELKRGIVDGAAVQVEPGQYQVKVENAGESVVFEADTTDRSVQITLQP